jgi:phage shock protein PspC (stress-responsive transcriptional regulator)
MNEVTRIHLGRQPFTISVDAHKVLKAYLADIQKQVADPEVANEVELRMSELLTERGVTGEKVILPADVDFLKQQLGNPADFSEDDDQSAKTAADDATAKRLFRDTENGMVAGVAAGISNYFGLDVVLVRLIFVVLTIFGGGVGIVLYIVLWLVVQPATTVSEKLQMQGKSVTLGALKDSVSKADLPGAARRANNTVLPVINSIFRVIIKLVGVGFILTGAAMIFGLIVTKVYMLLHHGQLLQENLFPVGFREELVVTLGIILAVIVAIFLILIGIASFMRKWPIRGWITAVLLGLFLVGSAATAALTADAVPHVQERYEAMKHTSAVKGIQPFSKVVTKGEIDLSYISSPDYAVNVQYVDNPDLSKLKTYVTDGTLYVDSTQLDRAKHCTMLCLFPYYDMTLQIYAPNVEDFQTPAHTDIFYPAIPALPAKD